MSITINLLILKLTKLLCEKIANVFILPLLKLAIPLSIYQNINTKAFENYITSETKSKAPESVHPSYQLQLDVYSFLLNAMGYDTINKAYLAFYYPDECELHEGMPFNCTILEVKTNISRVDKLVDNAHTILNDEIPESNENCEYCRWISDNLSIEMS